MGTGLKPTDNWPSVGELKVSDAEVLAHATSQIRIGDDDKTSAARLYETFKEVKKESDGWIKYYMISTALLVIAAAHASTELSLFGAKLPGPLIGPTAIIYFSVCTAAYTNFEIKMRMFRTFFKRRLDGLRGPPRAEMLMRYPLAFIGSEFLPPEMRPIGWTLGRGQLAQSIPAAVVLGLTWVAAVFGLAALLGYNFYAMYLASTVPSVVKWAVAVAFGGTMTVSAKMLRSPGTRHLYETA